MQLKRTCTRCGEAMPYGYSVENGVVTMDERTVHVDCGYRDKIEALQKRCGELESMMHQLLLDGDNLADALATIFEGTIHKLEWDDTRERAKRLLTTVGERKEGV